MESVYAPTATGRCPCSRGAVGRAHVVADLSELVRTREASSIVRWPRSESSGVARQLFWLRKFRGVRMSSPGAFPSCHRRATTLSQPCDLPVKDLLQPTPKPGRRAPAGLNLTRGRSAFWMAFAWHQQYAHWTLEHLPRMWYHEQLCALLPRPPVLVLPKSMPPWQVAVLRALPSVGGRVAAAFHPGGNSVGGGGARRPRRVPPAPVLALSPPHHFSTLYVPGMLAHIGLLLTPQALNVYTKLRVIASAKRLGLSAVASQLLLNGGANRFGGDGGGARRLFSLRLSGGVSAGSARVLADARAISAGLRSLGFAPIALESLSLAAKAAALARATDVVFECGSAMANAMLLPSGARLTLLCMRDHTSSKGCYMQLLATRYTAAPVTTLRVGEPSHAPRDSQLTRPNQRNNVQPHAAWTVQVEPTLRAIASLARLPLPLRRTGGGGASGSESEHAVPWPPLPTCDSKVAPRALAPTHEPPLAASSASSSPSTSPSPRWWEYPAETWAATAHERPGIRSRVFALAPCPSTRWDSPGCWELATRRGHTARSGGASQQLEWVACALASHCTRWRWCVQPRPHANGSAPARDRYINCEVP